MELNDDNLTLSEVLNEFQNFLLASGYRFPVGAELDIVSPKDDWDDQWTTDNWDDRPEDTTTYVDLDKPSKWNFTDDDINAEVIRMRDSTPGLSEEAYELAAYHNLARKAEEGV